VSATSSAVAAEDIKYSISSGKKLGTLRNSFENLPAGISNPHATQMIKGPK
jgi:hypothetical protein